jgi:hypothetical protein
MDQIVIDTGADSFPVGTTATVFGPDGGATPTIQNWARWADGHRAGGVAVSRTSAICRAA